MKTAFFFPGQGSQKVGMVHDLYEKYDSVKKIIREADDTLGFSISKMMFEGPDTELMKTEFTQPAILTASVCCWQVLKEEGHRKRKKQVRRRNDFSAAAQKTGRFLLKASC